MNPVRNRRETAVVPTTRESATGITSGGKKCFVLPLRHDSPRSFHVFGRVTFHSRREKNSPSIEVIGNSPMPIRRESNPHNGIRRRQRGGGKLGTNSRVVFVNSWSSSAPPCRAERLARCKLCPKANPVILT
jgi:hypothetical protein